MLHLVCISFFPSFSFFSFFSLSLFLVSYPFLFNRVLGIFDFHSDYCGVWRDYSSIYLSKTWSYDWVPFFFFFFFFFFFNSFLFFSFLFFSFLFSLFFFSLLLTPFPPFPPILQVLHRLDGVGFLDLFVPCCLSH